MKLQEHARACWLQLRLGARLFALRHPLQAVRLRRFQALEKRLQLAAFAPWSQAGQRMIAAHIAATTDPNIALWRVR